MNEIDKAIDILVDCEADMNYTKQEIANAYLLAIQALREKEAREYGYNINH
jgi:H2-forming N5,N10-methylenetetrahydromethanopterin dehydrogenase-like enzyme